MSYREPAEALMPHRVASLSETGRPRLARGVVEDRWPLRPGRETFRVALTTLRD